MEKKKCMKPYITVQNRIKTYITKSKHWFLGTTNFIRFNTFNTFQYGFIRFLTF